MLKNATYLEQYVPDADQVSRVEVSLDYPVEYKGDSVRVARQAQKEILSHAEIYRENKTDDSTQIIFYYYLKMEKRSRVHMRLQRKMKSFQKYYLEKKIKQIILWNISLERIMTKFQSLIPEP